MRISDWSSDVCSSDLIVVEKEFPFSISLYTLPAADIERGKVQMRMAIRRFADCLAADHWPAYADEPTEVGLHFAARKTIDFHGSEQDAALINAQEGVRSEEHTSELQSLMRTSYAVFCLKKKKK